SAEPAQSTRVPSWIEREVEPLPRLSVSVATPRSWPIRAHRWLDRFGNVVLRNAGSRGLPRALIIGGLIALMLVLLATVRREDAGAVTATQTASLAPDVSRLVAGLGSAQESGFHNMV